MNTPSTFQALLDQQHQWPCVYTFKFIVPRDSANQLLTVFASSPGLSVRESKKGSYLSITAELIMPSSESVMAVYEAVAEIKGIVCL